MKSSVLRVAKGTKVEFFWSHLYHWYRDQILQMKPRGSLLGRMPTSLLTLIIGYTVEAPLPEVDFRSWFSASLPICRVTLVQKKEQNRYSWAYRQSRMSYVKAYPKNFWALKKRLNLVNTKLSSIDVEKLFQLFDGFDYKSACIT